MRVLEIITLLPVLAQAINIVLSNDDGWAEINIRQLYYALAEAGNDVVLSASAYNRSGTGSLDAPPLPLLTPGEFDSIPAGSSGIGNNASMPRFNYVNSFPATAMRYGIQTFSQKFFGKQPDLAVAGFNVGGNAGIVTQVSGTVGAAVEAVRRGIPGIAFSGYTGEHTAWNTSPVPQYVRTYSELSTRITQVLISSGVPYLPSNVWLNVNLPESSATACTTSGEFKFVLSRIYDAHLFTPKDTMTCGTDRLPSETKVVDTQGCYVSISVGWADTKTDASAAAQEIVLKKISSILSCLPA